jgi:hypothetical protein
VAQATDKNPVALYQVAFSRAKDHVPRINAYVANAPLAQGGKEQLLFDPYAGAK